MVRALIIRSRVLAIVTRHLLAGLPSPEYFPFTSVSADVLLGDALSLTTQRSRRRGLQVGRYTVDAALVDSFHISNDAATR
jgi:hypothetical protein